MTPKGDLFRNDAIDLKSGKIKDVVKLPNTVIAPEAIYLKP